MALMPRLLTAEPWILGMRALALGTLVLWLVAAALEKYRKHT